MNKIVSRGLWFTVILGGLSLAGIGAANAAETTGDGGAASGDQAGLSISLPVTLGGNAISVIGGSTSSDATTSTPPAPPAPQAAASTSGLAGVLSGDQALLNVSVPVTAGGNAVSVIGDSASGAAATSSAGTPSATAPPDPASSSSATASGNSGILGGDQLPASAAVPVAVSGNAISVIGDSSSSNATTPVSTAALPGATNIGDTVTSGNSGILAGLQLPIGLNLPVTIAGNAVSVIGDGTTTGTTTTTVPGTPGTPGAPGTPGTPGTPSTPAVSGNPGISATPAGYTTGANGVSASARTAGLADTGSDLGGLWGAIALLLLAGLGLLVGSRRAARLN